MRPNTHGLRCFVAMAIRDDSDTNTLYFKVLKPLLKQRLGIAAFRIDELHHNENIDVRLLQEIDRSHLLLADLTYERPSVYFEAGYALGRKIPVVYSSRADHLGRDPNHQVHFDLRQRNIVPWRTPRDTRYARLLVARIRRTLAPSLRARADSDKQRRLHQQFIALSPTRRSAALEKEGADFLRMNRFRSGRARPGYTPDPSRGYRLVGGGVAECATVFVAQSISKKLLQQLPFLNSLIVPKEVQEAPRRHFHIVLLSEGTVTRSRVEAALHDFSQTSDTSWTAEASDTRTSLHIIGGVKSVRMLKSQLATLSARVFRRVHKPSR